VAVWIVSRVRRTRATTSSGDVLERFEAAARELVPAKRVAAMLATELAVFYYAFAAWRRAPHVTPGARAFSLHQQSGAAALCGVLAGVSVMEAVLVHLLVMRWSATAAWALTALSVYGAVWLVALARAFVLRPVLLEGAELVVRSSMMWSVRVPLRAIAAIDPGGAASGLRVPMASQPNVTLLLSGTVTARGMYGITRQVDRIALAVDHPDAFVGALRATA